MIMTPLRQFAHAFAAIAAPGHTHVRIAENKTACRAGKPAYDVYVMVPGKTRGKCIGSIPYGVELMAAERNFNWEK